MIVKRGSWAGGRWAIVVALMLTTASALSYPGGTVLDESSRGYSFTHNFLSDLGCTVAFNYRPNVVGATLFGVSVLTGVLMLAYTIIVTVRSLSGTPGARMFGLLAAAAGILVCLGFVGVALTPVDRMWRFHELSTMVAFRSFPVATALLAIGTARDARFRPRATVGWVTLTMVLAGFVAMRYFCQGLETDQELVIQVMAQKIMAATILSVLWLESREVEVAYASARAPRE